MRSISILLVSILVLSTSQIILGNPGDPPPKDPDKIQVLLLGYHYLPHDIMDTDRQEEVRALAQQLTRFEADKIVLDLPFQSLGEAQSNIRYQEYLQGLRPLNRSVQEQLGFRLAEYLDHETIYGIEDQQALNLSTGISSIHDEEVLKRVSTLMQDEQRIESAKQSQSLMGSLAEYFAYLNRPETLDYEHSVLLQGLSQLTASHQPIGSQLLSEWYGYHVRLYANLQQVAESGQKLVVLLPSKHLPYFQELLESDTRFEWVSAAPYLEIQ